MMFAFKQRGVWSPFASKKKSPITDAWLYRAVTESANLVEFRERLAHRYGEDLLPQADKLYAELKVRYASGQRIPFPFRGESRSNTRQNPLNRRKWILRTAVIVLALMLLFPPFEARDRSGWHHWYGFLLSSEHGNVNIGLLALQWLLVTFIAGVAWVMPDLSKSKDNPTQIGPGDLN